jgi:exopolysaccharide biosynthesis protein
VPLNPLTAAPARAAVLFILAIFWLGAGPRPAQAAKRGTPAGRHAKSKARVPKAKPKARVRPGGSQDFSFDISSQKTLQAADGVKYVKYFLHTSHGAMQIHTVQIDPLSSYALMPVIANGQLNTVASVSKMSKKVSAVAAINGGFFDTGRTRLPVGLVKIKRRIVFEQYLNRGVLGIDEQGQLHFDRFQLKSYLTIPAVGASSPIMGYNRPRKQGELIVYSPEFGPTTKTNDYGVELILHRISPDRVDKPFILLEPDRYIVTGVNRKDTTIPSDGVVISIHKPALKDLDWLNKVYLGMELQLTTNVPKGWESYPYLLGGGPLLLKNGEYVLDAREEHFGNYFNSPNARTAVGTTEDGRQFIIVVDKAGSSGGATWGELASVCQRLLNCSDAMGFDGGGSSTMFVGDTIVNAPAGGGQRSVANILAVVPLGGFI